MAKLRTHSTWLVQVTHQSYFDPLSQQSPSMNKWQGVSGTTEQVDAEHYWLTHRLNRCLTSLSCIYDNWFKEETQTVRWELYLLVRSDAISSKLIKCLWVTQKMLLLITSCFLTFSVLWRNTGRLHFLNSLWISVWTSSTRWIESCCRTHWAPVHDRKGKEPPLVLWCVGTLMTK